MKKLFAIGLVFLIASLLIISFSPVSAQQEEFGIRLRRNMGYGAGSNIRGNFTISLTGDISQVVSVAYLIDDVLMAEVERAPFSFQFHTDYYEFGVHRLQAQVRLLDGRSKTTAAVRVNFVTPQEERNSLVMIFGGMGAIFVLGLVIFGIVQMLVIKRKPRQKGAPGTLGDYGILGAAICPKCKRPFPRHIWGINMITGKYDRCEHCGKWSITRRATQQELKAAEAAQFAIQKSYEEEKLALPEPRNILDDTRYIDEI